MQAMFGISLFLNEANPVPVELCNATGGELTGYVASSVSILTALNGAAFSAFSPASGTWSEQGHGIYQLTFPASSLNVDNAPFNYRVATNDSLAVPFNGSGRVGHRLDQYECHISPQYDEVTQGFLAMVWLSKNGVLVSNPLTCQIWLKDTAGNVPVNLTGAAPQMNADGVFVLSAASIALATEMTYECKIQVTDSTGAVWLSVDGAITFN